MKVVKANLDNLDHLTMYDTFCKENHVNFCLEKSSDAYSKRDYFFLEKGKTILETCEVEILEDLRKASLQVMEKESSKRNHVFTLIKECVEYLFTKERVEDIFLEVNQQEIDTELKTLGYDVLSLGKNESGCQVYSVLKENIEEE